MDNVTLILLVVCFVPFVAGIGLTFLADKYYGSGADE